jgi:parallel beta-helix repeat protein
MENVRYSIRGRTKVIDTRKRAAFFLISFLLFSFITCDSIVKPIRASSQLIVVLPGESIQEAINNANAGDTIYVQPGIYQENVILNKSMSLIGGNSSETFIDGGEESNVLTVVSSNVVVSGFTIQNGGKIPMPGSGVQIGNLSVNVLICDNIIKQSYYGVRLFDTYNSKVSRNIIIDNDAYGIYFSSSSSNYMVGNTIANHPTGVYIATVTSKFNVFYHNNFINNTHQIEMFALTRLDDGYPSGGNYWNDYVGVDEKSGPNQDQPESDGIGDAPYPDIASKWDKYPLKGLFTEFDAGTWGGAPYNVDVVSNSKVSDFYFNPDVGAFIRFNVTGDSETSSFCRVTIPKTLLCVEDGWTVFVGDEQILDYTIIPNVTYTYMHFIYPHSTKVVEIRGTHAIPEFASIEIWPFFMAITLILVILTKKLRKQLLKNPTNTAS